MKLKICFSAFWWCTSVMKIQQTSSAQMKAINFNSYNIFSWVFPIQILWLPIASSQNLQPSFSLVKCLLVPESIIHSDRGVLTIRISEQTFRKSEPVLTIFISGHCLAQCPSFPQTKKTACRLSAAAVAVAYPPFKVVQDFRKQVYSCWGRIGPSLWSDSSGLLWLLFLLLLTPYFC